MSEKISLDSSDCFLLLSRSQIKSSIAVDEVIDGCISQKSICLYLWIKSQK